MEFLRYSATYIQMASFFVSLLMYYKYKHTPLKILPLYYALVAFVEFLCFHFYKSDNVWLYNFLQLFQVNFFAYIFYQYLEGQNKKIVLVLTVLYNLFFVGVYVLGFNDIMVETASYSHVFGMIILIIFLLMMFNYMLKIENYEGLTHNLLFWLCFSLMVFIATSLPLFSISRWSDVLGDFKSNIVRILIFSIIFSHLILIFGFIWSKKRYTY